MPSHASDRPPRSTKTAVVLTTSVLTAVLILIGIGAMWLVVQTGAGLGPTPTPTPTAVDATRTPTPDRRATNVAEDMLTQIAYAATIVGQRTPSAIGVCTGTCTRNRGTYSVANFQRAVAHRRHAGNTG